MNIKVFKTTKLGLVTFNEGDTFEVLSTKKIYVLMRINKEFIPFRLPKKYFKEIFNISEDLYTKLYNGEI